MKKRFGLRSFHRSTFPWFPESKVGDPCMYEYTTWHRTERARDDAIERANRTTYVVAMMKVDR
jgi:hypothetical protein